MNGKIKKGFRLPHIYALLFGIMAVYAAASWILPAGELERTVNEAGRSAVVPGTYHVIASLPVGIFDTVKAVYTGMVDAGSIVFFLFVAAGSIGLAWSLADLPQFSGSGYHMICHIIMVVIASAYTIQYALKVQQNPASSVVYGDDFGKLAVRAEEIAGTIMDEAEYGEVRLSLDALFVTAVFPCISFLKVMS